jgi:hypothetical protein
MVPARPTVAVTRALVAWLAVAVGAGMTGLPSLLLGPPLAQGMIALLTVAILTVAVTSTWFREWLTAVDVRALVLVHVTRFAAGLAFLVLYGRGELPYAFAVPGGIGDMAVALLAVGVVLATDARAARRRWLVVAWNVVGLVDILLVVATAARIASADPAAMAALLRLPLVVLPTFLVPIIIATHLILFVRLLRRTP